MTLAFDELAAEAHRLGLKIGPIAERPDGKWRVYLQRGSDIFRFREGASVDATFAAVLDDVKKDHFKSEGFLE